MVFQFYEVHTLLVELSQMVKHFTFQSYLYSIHFSENKMNICTGTFISGDSHLARMNCLLMLELRTSKSKMSTICNSVSTKRPRQNPIYIVLIPSYFLSFWDIDKVDYILGIDRQPVLTSSQLCQSDQDYM